MTDRQAEHPPLTPLMDPAGAGRILRAALEDHRPDIAARMYERPQDPRRDHKAEGVVDKLARWLKLGMQS